MKITQLSRNKVIRKKRVSVSRVFITLPTHFAVNMFIFTNMGVYFWPALIYISNKKHVKKKTETEQIM